MGYAKSYELLEVAFRTDIASEATLGDIFLPNAAMPDLAIPVGKKIEKSELLNVGSIAVTHTCRVVEIDAAQLGQFIDLSATATWQGQPDPTMLLKQSVEYANAEESRLTRLYRGFTHGEMVSGDKAWEQYNAQRSAWLEAAGMPADTPEFELLPDDLDYPLVPTFFNVHVKSDIIGGNEDSIHDHAPVVAAAGQSNPQLGALSRFDRYYGTSVFGRINPETFQAMTTWLIEPSQA